MFLYEKVPSYFLIKKVLNLFYEFDLYKPKAIVFL